MCRPLVSLNDTLIIASRPHRLAWVILISTSDTGRRERIIDCQGPRRLGTSLFALAQKPANPTTPTPPHGSLAILHQTCRTTGRHFTRFESPLFVLALSVSRLIGPEKLTECQDLQNDPHGAGLKSQQHCNAPLGDVRALYVARTSIHT